MREYNVGDEIRVFEIINSPYPIIKNGHHCAEKEYFPNTRYSRLATIHTKFKKDVLFRQEEIKQVATMRITKLKQK